MFWILTNYKVFLESQKIQNTQYNIRYEKKSWETDTTWDLQLRKKHHFQKSDRTTGHLYAKQREREKNKSRHRPYIIHKKLFKMDHRPKNYRRNYKTPNLGSGDGFLDTAP